jgi:hypothetical protein
MIQNNGLFAFFDLKHDFPSEWYKANNPQASSSDRGVIKLANLTDRLPFLKKSSTSNNGQTSDAVYNYPKSSPDLTNKMPVSNTVYIYSNSSPDLKYTFLTLTNLNTQIDYKFSQGPAVGAMICAKNTDNINLDDWQLKIDLASNPKISNLWVIVNYGFS